MEHKGKKQVSILSFTPGGQRISLEVAKSLEGRGYTVEQKIKCKGQADSMSISLTEWTQERFFCKDVLIYIGAAGIAVRGIAPFVKSKSTDPAVLVIDERGTYCIPLLSGHLGGANAVAKEIQEDLGIQGILTTGTDVNGKWAVDVFAKKNHLWISDMELAKDVSARILRGEQIRILIEEGGEAEGFEPIEEITVFWEREVGGSEETGAGEEDPEEAESEVESEEQEAKESRQSILPHIYIGTRRRYPGKEVLCLVPSAVVAGIGCRKGTSCLLIEEAIDRGLKEANLWKAGLRKLVSITEKAQEKGILEYCEKEKLEWETYPAKQLQALEGQFTESAFVEQTVGVGNVCERSAICGLGEDGRGEASLLLRKKAEQGVTVALARGRWRVRFETE